jgi:hypothetical protein
MEIAEKHNAEIENFAVKQFRQRMFVRQSAALYGSEYTFVDNLPEQIEALPGFTNWESFSKEWDIYWVGLDPRSLKWVAGRHNSPIRKLVLPLRLVIVDERTGRMQETYIDKGDVLKMDMPFTEPLPETEEDRIISDSLSGKVVVDEPDKAKAERLLQETITKLTTQLEMLKRLGINV